MVHSDSQQKNEPKCYLLFLSFQPLIFMFSFLKPQSKKKSQKTENKQTINNQYDQTRVFIQRHKFCDVCGSHPAVRFGV